MSLKSKVEQMPGYNSIVRPVHYLQALVAASKYHYPARKLRVIGVTGTNGKTTTCFMIWKMLNEAGHKAGLLTTVGWSADGSKIHRQYEHMTTERVDVLNKRMRAVADSGAEFLVLETTSHALMQSRILGVPIEIAVFTNLTHEHLDYHKTFANYRKAKMRLFKKSKYGVVNADDPSAEFFIDLYASDDIKTYGIKQGDLRATDIIYTTAGVEYSCGDIKIKTRIPGKFNVYNSLAAVGVGQRLGLTDKQISDGIYALKSVEGRMNRIESGQEFEVIVDYAHTPDALENVFSSVDARSLEASAPEDAMLTHRTISTARSASPSSLNLPDASASRAAASSEMSKTATLSNSTRRIISVHGGAGRRDESTRSLRGEILAEHSDIVIITEDDSRDEDPQKIAKMFVEGAKKAGKKEGKDLLVILDRREAIKKAFDLAQPGDLVLILGKGHEKTILRASGPVDFEDAKVAEELLSQL